MEVLMTLQGSQMEADDPITSYMLQVCLNLKPCSQFFWQFNFFFSFDLSVRLCRHGQDCVNALVRISYHTWVLLCPLCSSLLSSNQMWVSLLLDQKMKMVNLMTRGMFSFFFHSFDSMAFSLCFVSWITFIFWWCPYGGNVESNVCGHRRILRICHVMLMSMVHLLYWIHIFGSSHPSHQQIKQTLIIWIVMYRRFFRS